MKITPFTVEERLLQLHDLKAICGKVSDVHLVYDALHEDLRELLDINNSPVDDPLEKEADEAAAEVLSEEPVSEGLPFEVRTAATEAIEDGDGLMDGTSAPVAAPKAPVAAPRAPVVPRAPVAAPRAPVAAPASKVGQITPRRAVPVSDPQKPLGK